MNIGRRIQELRESRGMSKAELARRGGTTRNTLYRIEAGKTKPSSAMVAQIARGLDLDPGELFPKAEGVPNSLDELLERRGARTRYLADKNLSDTLEQLPEEDVLQVAREVREEREALAEDRARLNEELQRNPRNREAFRLLSELVDGSLRARFAIAVRMGQKFEKVEPGTPEAEVADAEVEGVAQDQDILDTTLLVAAEKALAL